MAHAEASPRSCRVETGNVYVDLVDLGEALRRFSDEDPRAGRLVALRFFAGLTLEEAAETLGISRSTAKRDWSYAKAWLHSATHGDGDSQ